MAENSVGETASDWAIVRTKEARPVGLSNPTVVSTSSYGISLSWTPPQRPNGKIIQYMVYYQKQTNNRRIGDEQVIGVDGNLIGVSISGLEAFSSYFISLEAINSAGSVKSNFIMAQTLEGFPEGLPNFGIEKVSTGTSVIMTWSEPTKPNGVITIYRIYESTDDTSVYMGLLREFEYRRLIPFTSYSLSLEACNRAGCTMGKPQSFMTAEVAPVSQPSPTIGAVNATHVTLQWTPPIDPNGAIISYEVLRRSTPSRRKRSIDIVQNNIDTIQSIPFVSKQTISLSHHYHDQTLTNVMLFVNKCKSELENESCIIKTHEEDLKESGTIQDSYSYRNSVRRTKRQTSQDNSGSSSGSGLDYDVVYRTSDTDKDSFSYTDTNLEPHTQYQYSIRAINSQGHTDSTWHTVFTEQAPPQGVQPPMLSHISDNIHSIRVQWSPPLQLNGILQSYQIQQNDSIPNSFSADADRNFIDSQLSAFTVYSYKLTACTGGGCTSSDLSFIRTKEAPPLQVNPPTLQSSDSNSIQALWTSPDISNGEITHFRLKMGGMFVYTGPLLTFTIDDLVPYSLHRFTLTACTNGGCTESGEVTGRPLDAPPMDMMQPLLRVLSSRSIEVNWAPPINPNGIISSYDVRRDGRLIYTSSIALTSTLPLSYSDFGLEPGQRYTYTLIARNRYGNLYSLESLKFIYVYMSIFFFLFCEEIKKKFFVNFK